jgi:hypothetical protein
VNNLHAKRIDSVDFVYIVIVGYTKVSAHRQDIQAEQKLVTLAIYIVHALR